MKTSGIACAGSLVLLVVVSLPLQSKQWPAESVSLTGSFAGEQHEGFVQGLEFSEQNEQINPWDSGRIIWKSDTEHPLSFDSNMLVLQHNNQFRSRYMDIEVSPDLPGTVRAGDSIGYSGTGNWSFSILDTSRSSIVNPLSLLPARNNILPPGISTVNLVRGNRLLAVANGMSIDSGTWSLSLGLLYQANRASPLEISLFWLGRSIASMKFDELHELDGEILAGSSFSRPFDRVYDSEGRIQFQDLVFNSGRGNLELRLLDDTGKLTLSVWTLNVES